MVSFAPRRAGVVPAARRGLIQEHTLSSITSSRIATSARWALAVVAMVLPAGGVLAASFAWSLPDADATAARRQLAEAAGAACAEAGGEPESCLVTDVERRELVAGVAEYAFTLRTGSGPFEAIRLHRVVRERAPWRPERARDGIFLVHGDAWDFRAAFFAGAAAPDAGTLPVWLAERGVDVWGIDLRWTLVPAETTDFDFMADWGFATDLHDLDVGLLAARVVRLVTGSGPGQLDLLGWSRGAQLGYAFLSREAGRPWWARHVEGFVPVDVYLKTDDATLRENACTRAAGLAATLAAETWQDATGALLATIGELATADPDGASPVLAGLSNRQVALVAGGATFLFFPPGLAPVPHYHFTGAAFDAASSLPTSLLYTPEARWLDSLRATAPYEPTRLLFEAETLVCDEEDLPFDDRLGEVEVPVLYVGAAGGFGATGLHTTTLLGSTDVESLIVSVVPPEAVLVDYGHADLFQAADAPQRVFQPILDWLLTH